MRYVARVGNGTTPSRDRLDYWTNGTVPWLASGQVNDYIVREARERITPLALREASLRLLPAGSVVLGMVGQGKTRGMAAYLSIDAVINQNLAGVVPGRELDGRFLHYTFIAAYDFQRNYGRGGNQAALNCAIVGSFPTLLPPRAEQDQIVAYLRAQDAHVARFVKAKRDLIALLTEQKLRIIDQAVTRGLDPSARLRPSGIDWLGKVPEHWESKPLKRWARINSRTLGERTDPDFEFRYVDIGSVKTGRLAKELERMRFEAAPSRARRVLRRGDTIISTVRTYLKAIWYVNEDADDLIASTGFAVLTPGAKVEPEYLGYVTQSSAFVNRVTANSIGIAYPAIAESVLGRFPVAMPPSIPEQQAIVERIKADSAPLDQAIERAMTEIKLIREYRDRLIADAVTGQVDLRGWAPGPDDVATDEDLAAFGEEDGETPGDEDDAD